MASLLTQGMTMTAITARLGQMAGTDELAFW